MYVVHNLASEGAFFREKFNIIRVDHFGRRRAECTLIEVPSWEKGGNMTKWFIRWWVLCGLH